MFILVPDRNELINVVLKINSIHLMTSRVILIYLTISKKKYLSMIKCIRLIKVKE